MSNVISRGVLEAMDLAHSDAATPAWAIPPYTIVDGDRFTLVDAAHNDIADLFNNDKDTVGITRDASFATAQLFAAAPDLYEALRNLVETVGASKVPQTVIEAGLQVMVTVGPALEVGRSALARARGEQP